jgi:endonuclease/exonuclease/phosphatase family metal-dependent hydrolase
MLRPRRLAAAVVTGLLVGALTALAVPTTVQAAAPAQAERRVTAMTYNLYLGADLVPLFGKSGVALVAAAAEVYAQVVQTDFPARADAIARQLELTEPDVVGLQEVALWRTAPLSDPTAMTTTYDFLALLLAAAQARGLSYRAVASNPNFAGALPISATTMVSFLDRDVILVRADLPVSQLVASNPQSGTFDAALTVPLGGASIAVPRGWSSIDVKLRGKSYRFVDTHLEAFHPLARNAQAAELIAVLSTSPLPVVLVGDLNSTPTDATSAHPLMLAAGFTDAWTESMGTATGYTSGQAADVANAVSTLDSRIDFVMHDSDGYVDAVSSSAQVVGDELADRTPGGLWPSDHAGVVVTLTLAKP